MSASQAQAHAVRVDDVSDEKSLAERYREVRKQSEAICSPLEVEDYGLQTAAFASPPKWHLAHTAWFFETLLLKPFLTNYQEFHPQFGKLFNSYYDTIGEYHPRPERGLLSRPLVKEIYQYREHIDSHMERLLADTGHEQHEEILRRTMLGIQHEQQHQELLYTDIKYNFSYNPLKPAYTKTKQTPTADPTPMNWHDFSEGLYTIGNSGESFCYDNETPPHPVYLQPFRLASRPVNNAEYLEFINDGGYKNSDLWLSDAWRIIREQRWQAPLHWQHGDEGWRQMTLGGMKTLDPHAPVCHVSYFEAAAYARWAGKRLPSEAEWEVASATLPTNGNFVEQGYLHPVAPQAGDGLQQMFGDVWEWTQSAYTPYPGYKQLKGPLGEYNGKFMSSQMILRGGSCVTPQNHIRNTYRNFFYPEERWQFSGFRLAEEIK